MKETLKKQSTVEAIDEMIRQADKGPSGFWVEDRKGCGNPDIFPEFEEGMRNGRLIQKEHYYCPWNTAILYGSERGNIQTGCYHSCSIKDAVYLSKEMLVRVLAEFRKRMLDGYYDNPDSIPSLLSDSDIEYIKNQKEIEHLDNSRAEQSKRKRIVEKAGNLLKKHKEYAATIISNYGKRAVQTLYGGSIDFDPDGVASVVANQKLSYNDYLDAQFNALGKTHRAFQWCYYNIPNEFKGVVEKISNGHICFQKVFVSGMTMDGEFFDYAEQHVWMDIKGFDNLKPGDCVKFSAEAYRYLKTGDGKQIDYGLRDPSGVDIIG